jgi:hypothetical protein
MKITVLNRNMTDTCRTSLSDMPTCERVNVMIDYENKKINMKEMKKESKLPCFLSIN